jgi:N-acetylglucosamine-6-phosphate deacetylase
MLAIINTTLVLANCYLPDAVILLDQGLIREFGERRKIPIPQGAQVLDAQGLFTGPGLLDIHTHAGGSQFFSDHPVPASRHLLQHGVTAVLPTLYFNLTRQGYLQAIARIREAAQSDPLSNIAGIYMEGPYLNPDFGADRTHNPWQGPIRKEEYDDLIRSAADLACIWAVAPERDGIEGFVRDVKERIPEAVFAVAHSRASPSQIEKLIPYGLALATHHTNATGDLQKYPEVRGVCVDETVNYHDDIYAELICDSRGIHVDPYMLRLIEKIKGKDRLILISDAFVIDGPVPPGYDGVTDINFDYEGEIAGSKLTLDVACRNMMVHTGCSLVDVFRYASANPARLLGWKNQGVISPGNIADLIVVDAWMGVKQVIKQGRLIQEFS